MDTTQLLSRISNGEDSYTQFKINITNSDQLTEEFVAFSNAFGGLLIIGVKDNGTINGLTDEDIHRLNQLIGNVINANIIPPIYPITQIYSINNCKILCIEISEGLNKPYSTNKGLYITKAGADKRKISPEELRRLFASSNKLFADECPIKKSSMHDLNTALFYQYLEKDNPVVFNELTTLDTQLLQNKLQEIQKDHNTNKPSLTTILENLKILSDGCLTLAGNLIFGYHPQKFTPSFYIDCVSFAGNDVAVNQFITKDIAKGTLLELYKQAFNFLKSNLKRKQVESDFNSQAKPEINEIILTELIVNALVHRDYFIQSSIKIFIFYNRVEIISPGKLTNSLNIESIKSGISIQRNPILNSICKNILPYSGYGSGIRRALQLNPHIEFINDINKEEFKCIIPRQLLNE